MIKTTMRDNLITTKETLEFLLNTNDDAEIELNKQLKSIIDFVSDELEFAIGL